MKPGPMLALRRADTTPPAGCRRGRSRIHRQPDVRSRGADRLEPEPRRSTSTSPAAGPYRARQRRIVHEGAMTDQAGPSTIRAPPELGVGAASSATAHRDADDSSCASASDVPTLGMQRARTRTTLRCGGSRSLDVEDRLTDAAISADAVVELDDAVAEAVLVDQLEVEETSSARARVPPPTITGLRKRCTSSTRPAANACAARVGPPMETSRRRPHQRAHRVGIERSAQARARRGDLRQARRVHDLVGPPRLRVVVQLGSARPTCPTSPRPP